MQPQGCMVIALKGSFSENLCCLEQRGYIYIASLFRVWAQDAVATLNQRHSDVDSTS